MEEFKNHDNCECGCGHDHEHEHDHECGCGHDHGEQTMTLILDDNTELKCTVIDIFDIGEKAYIALLPIGDDEVLLYQYVEKEGEDGFDLLNIESDEEFAEVEEAFFDLFEDGTFDGFDDEEDYDYDDYDDEDDEDDDYDE